MNLFLYFIFYSHFCSFLKFGYGTKSIAIFPLFQSQHEGIVIDTFDKIKLIICYWEYILCMTSEKSLKISKEELKQKLTPEQYEVCVNKGTEMAFTGKYNDYKKPGVY